MAHKNTSSETQGQLVGVGEKSEWARKKFGRKIFIFFSFSLFPAPTYCPWVSKDDKNTELKDKMLSLDFN